MGIIIFESRDARLRKAISSTNVPRINKTEMMKLPRLDEIRGAAAMTMAVGRSNNRASVPMREERAMRRSEVVTSQNQKPRVTGQIKLRYWAALERYAQGPNWLSAKLLNRGVTRKSTWFEPANLWMMPSSPRSG